MNSTQHKGASCELVACAWLLAQGYEVFRNVSACGPADIIAWRGEEILKLDVKSSASLNNHITITEKQREGGIKLLLVNYRNECAILDSFTWAERQRMDWGGLV